MLTALWGCSALRTPELSNDLQFYRGPVAPDGEKWLIQLCYSRQSHILTDPEGLLALLYAEQAMLPGLPLYVELKATEQGAVKHVLLAGGDARACTAELHGVELRAAGNDPDWAADLAGDRLEVRDQSRLLRLGFRVEERQGWIRGGREWVGRMQTAGRAERKIELGLSESGCRDRAGIWYGLTAVMKLEGRTYRGCARYGDLTSSSLAGVYRSELVGENGPVRTIALQIAPDGTAELNEDYHQGQSVTVRRGTWRWLPSGKLMLHLLERDGQAEQQVRLFSRSLDGSLLLQGFESEYGAHGLRLAPE